MDFKNILQTLSHLSEGAQKKAKPDFLDMDKDGNKKEPMKKASKDAKKALVGKAISKKKGTLKDWFEHIDAKYLAENTAPEIDGSVTANYASKMVKALNDRFGGEYFEHAFNKDGSVTIVKQGMWADEAARGLGRDPDRDADLKLPGALTGKNFNDAIDPWYREFRNKGWRFDQPVNGKFTIAVNKQQGVTEAVPSGTIDSPATTNYALKIIKALDDRFSSGYFEHQTNKDGSVTIFKPGMWADEAGRALGRDPDRDPDYKRPDVLTGKNFNDAIDPWYYEFRNKGWRFDQPMNGKFTIAVMKKPDVAETEQVTIQPAKQNAQVIKQGNQTLGTVTNPALASTIKSAIGKGEMSLAGAQLGETEDEYSAKKARAGKDIGKPGKNFAKIAKSAGKKYGSKESGEKVAGAVLAKLRNLKEAERPSDDSDMGAGLGAGRSRTTFEGAKPDFLDMDKDGNKKESMKKAVADKKKQKVKESMNHRISAARLEGKSHGLRGHAHSGKRYEDLEEMKAYHEGYKEGLDECYGQGVYEGVLGTLGGAALGGMLGGPVGAAIGAVGGQEMTKGGSAVFEKSLPATVSGMASQEMQEGEEFGAYDYEQLAQAVYDEHPDLSTSGDAKELMNVGYELAVEMFGPKVARQSFGYKQDFPSDFASAYRYLQQNSDAVDEGVASSIGGVAGKVLPGVGATLAAQDAYKRQQAGDTTGAVISGLSGAAGLVPGVGTAASLAGTGIQAARDKARTGSWFPDQKQIAAASQKDPFTESLEIQLQKLLSESNEKVDEGLSVTISKGQQGAPDSVSVSAQDGEADQLLGLIKNAGLGLFGDEQGTSNYGAPSGSSEVNSPGGIEVVDDHDGMMGIMKKLSGIQQSGDEDYADEEGEEDCGCEGECDCGQQECNECGGMGMHESSCSSSKEMIDEVESEDQQEFEVAEDNAPDSGEAESTADENAEAEEDKALAGADSGNEEELDEVEQIDEKVKIFQRDQNPNPQRDYAGTPVRYPKGHSAHGDAHRAIVAKAAKASRREGSLKGSDKSTWRRQNDNHQLHAGHADKEYNPKMEEYELNEWANNAGGKGTDEAFERDIEFMTNIISGGLNKRKSTGQTTVPVIASQTERQYSQESTSINESINDWQKLAGIKKL
jgi:hypothetical protein